MALLILYAFLRRLRLPRKSHKLFGVEGDDEGDGDDQGDTAIETQFLLLKTYNGGFSNRLPFSLTLPIKGWKCPTSNVVYTPAVPLESCVIASSSKSAVFLVTDCQGNRAVMKYCQYLGDSYSNIETYYREYCAHLFFGGSPYTGQVI